MSDLTPAFGPRLSTPAFELPFKGNANPDPLVGWDGARSARLGAAVLRPVLKDIRSRK